MAKMATDIRQDRLEFRRQLLERLRADLVGPLSADEVLEAETRPSERYLSGILFPRNSDLPDDEEEELAAGEADEGGSDAASAATAGVSLHNVKRPSTAGVSFAVDDAAKPMISLRVLGAIYKPRWRQEDGSLSDTPGDPRALRWCRHGFDVQVPPVSLVEGRMKPVDLTALGVSGLEVHFQVASGQAHDGFHGRTVTAVLVNAQADARDRVTNEERTFFQVELRIAACPGTQLIARPARRSAEDPAFALLYRDVHEYAAGHTCSADWSVETKDGQSVVMEVRTCWVPSQDVEAVSERGDAACEVLQDHCLDASWLSAAPLAELSVELERLPKLYEDWLADVEQRIVPTIQPDPLKARAGEHIRVCRTVAARMRAGIKCLQDVKVLKAFHLANSVMQQQYRWSQRADVSLKWRPFQLGFQLLVLGSLTKTDHPDREIMDLLWFPTGGGKTEAYLWLIVFGLLHRRLREGKPDQGAGTGAMMRYTLRLLTIDQFQRAARSIMALEHTRRMVGAELLGTEPFSIGLWVGGGATPNSIKDAKKQIAKDQNPTPRQLTDCPCCGGTLDWRVENLGQGDSVTVRCVKRDCPCSQWLPRGLPIFTVDEDIYRYKPSLVIGTIDKFAQIAFKASDTRAFFGDRYPPPDLILQDELHLISGPLGSLAGLYEAAIDELCTRRNANGVVTHRPKIIGSTATIKRAQEQILQLFNREACQFPPPVIDANRSFFARPAAEDEKVGRVYVAVTTAGRSPKFSLQAVYATLLQSGQAIPITPDEERDPWWTLLGYFNSLRELGGSLVMLSDDVPISMSMYAKSRGESVMQNGYDVSRRKIESFEELTSRRDQVELRDAFRRLKTVSYSPTTGSQPLDAVLASNMVSVGVDVDRLGIMCIFAQPKQTAEYIQASSRVGRKFPGIIVIVYKNSFARDRSRYETFRSWNQAFYRDVEPSSVTPFAPRARDRALHAAIVAVAAAKVHGLLTSPRLTAALRTEVERVVIEPLLARAFVVDQREIDGTRRDVKAFLDRWQQRTQWWDGKGEQNASYKKDRTPERALLISAEEAAARLATMHTAEGAVPTPNSMRDVEASTPFKLIERLQVGPEVQHGA